jgi:hypothetical protein
MHTNLCKIKADNKYSDAQFSILFSDRTMTLSELNEVAYKFIKNITIDGKEIFKIHHVTRVESGVRFGTPLVELSLNNPSYIIMSLNLNI